LSETSLRQGFSTKINIFQINNRSYRHDDEMIESPKDQYINDILYNSREKACMSHIVQLFDIIRIVADTYLYIHTLSLLIHIDTSVEHLDGYQLILEPSSLLHHRVSFEVHC